MTIDDQVYNLVFSSHPSNKQLGLMLMVTQLGYTPQDAREEFIESHREDICRDCLDELFEQERGHPCFLCEGRKCEQAEELFLESIELTIEEMNENLQQYARNWLKENLAKCTAAEQHLFKRMYSHNNLDATIEEAVDNMDESKLDRAMQQVEATLKKK